MVIGNREIWDKGVGMGATETIFGGQSSSPNYDPLMSDPNASPAATTATETPTPETPAAPAAPAQPAGPHPKVKQAQDRFDMAQLKYQQALQALGGNSDPGAKYGGTSLYWWQRHFFEAQQALMQAKSQYGG